jgi:hypothetical protein
VYRILIQIGTGLKKRVSGSGSEFGSRQVKICSQKKEKIKKFHDILCEGVLKDI